MRKKDSFISFSINEKVGDFLVPFWIRNIFRKQLESFGVINIPYQLFSYVFYLTLIINSFATWILIDYFLRGSALALMIFVGIITFIVNEIILYMFIYLTFRVYYVNLSYHHVKDIEKALPDFLTELNLHLRSGMPLNKALENSTNKELGYLNSIVEEVNKNIELGYDTKVALNKAAGKHKSSYLIEAADLIGKSDEEGGNSIVLIDRLISNMHTHHYMQSQIVTNVSGYIIFITLMALVIAPALFSASYHVLVLIKSMVNKIFVTGGVSNLGNFFLEITVDEEKYKTFTMFATLITAFCSAYLMSVIKEGHVKKALKIIFIFVVTSLASFYFFHWVLGIMFQKFLVI